MNRTVLVPIFAAFGSLALADSPNYSGVDVEEFMQLFRNGQPIERRVVPAKYLTAALQWGKQESEAGRDVPNLILRECTIPDHVKWEEDVAPSLEIRKCIFERAASFGSARFLHGATFAGSEFRPNVDALGRQLGFTDFENAEFVGKTDFTSARFESVFFTGARFTWPERKRPADKIVDFSHAEFRGELSFFNAEFLLPATFEKAQFVDWINFGQAKFHETLRFAETRFDAGATFAQCTFEKFTDFNGAVFAGPAANFSQCVIGKLAWDKAGLRFGGTKFEGTVDFSSAKVEEGASLQFARNTIQGNAFFYSMNCQGSLRFGAVTFAQRADFVGSRFRSIEVVSENPGSQALLYIGIPSAFAKRASFRFVECDTADFSDTEFRGYADLSDSKLGALHLNGTVFEDDADFQEAKVKGTISMERTQFKRRLRLDSRMLLEPDESSISKSQTRLFFQRDRGTPERLWRELEAAYERSGDVENKNLAVYQAELQTHPRHIGRWFWGYGVRPWRTVCWLALAYLCFTAAYATQIPTRGVSRWRRIWSAASFSANTAWRWSFGPEHSRGLFWKSVTSLQMISFKVGALLFLKALANTSPLLNELMSKFIPL